MGNQQSGGYHVEVVHENDKERFKCMLCLDIIRKATHGCKNHVFCRTCVQDYIQNKSSIEVLCPAGCNQSFNKTDLKSNEPYDHLINQIACKCPDCNWRGELLDYDQEHDKKCIEKKVECDVCNQQVKRKDMENHVLSECPKRPHPCQYCNESIPYEEHGAHEENCGDRLVNCTFSSVGCLHKTAIKDMAKHKADNLDEHLELVTSYFTRENKRLKLENTELRNIVETLYESLNVLTSRNIDSKSQDEHILLKYSSASLAVKFIKPVLLKDSCQRVINLAENDSLIIKEIYFMHDELRACFDKNDFTFIIRELTSECPDLTHYKEELNDLISTRKSIVFHKVNGKLINVFFKRENRLNYEDCYILCKSENDKVFTCKSKTAFGSPPCLLLSSWKVKLSSEEIIDIESTDERFTPLKKTMSRKYGCLVLLPK